MDALTSERVFFSEQANVAYNRIDALLRAYGVQHAAVRAVHAHRILHNSFAQALPEPADPEVIATHLVLDDISRALDGIADQMSRDGHEPVEKDRLFIAVRKSGIPRDHPEVFLGSAQLHEDDLNELRRVYEIQPAPRIQRMSMGAPVLRFESIDEVAEGTSAAFGKIPFFRRLVQALAAFGLLFIVYTFAK
jgi:hypothetical protein